MRILPVLLLAALAAAVALALGKGEGGARKKWGGLLKNAGEGMENYIKNMNNGIAAK